MSRLSQATNTVGKLGSDDGKKTALLTAMMFNRLNIGVDTICNVGGLMSEACENFCPIIKNIIILRRN